METELLNCRQPRTQMFWTEVNKHVITSVIFETVTSGPQVFWSPAIPGCVFVVLGHFVFQSSTVLCLLSVVHLVLASFFFFAFMLSGDAPRLWGLAANELWVRQNRNGAFV